MEKFILKYLRNRKHKPTLTCRLCRAIKKEPTVTLENGYLLDAKYPAIPKSKLYIRKQCSKEPSPINFYEILLHLDSNKKLMCVSNMLNNPTISSHWHVHIFENKYLPQFFVNLWNLESKLNPQNQVSKIVNEYGKFYIFPYRNLTIQKKSEKLQKLYEDMQLNPIRYLLTITNNYVLFCKLADVDEKISISSHAIYGYFFTSKKNKYNHMVTLDTQNILPLHTI